MAPNNGLTFKFSADTDGARRAIANMASSAGRNLTVLAGSAVLASRNLESISDAARRAKDGAKDFGQWVKDHRTDIGRVVKVYTAFKVAQYGLIAAAAGLTVAILGANKALQQMEDIFKAADAAGVSATFFQVFARQADKLKIKVDDVAAALKHARRATRLQVDDEGNRKLSEPVQLLRKIEEEVPSVGPLADIVNNSSDARERVEAILKAIREIQQEAERIGNHDLRLWAERLAQVSFGEKGKEIAEGIAAGNLELTRLKDEAIRADNIFEEGIVQRTKEVQRELEAANSRLADNMIPLMERLGSLALDFKSGWASIVDGIARAVEQTRKLNSEAGKLRTGFLDQLFGKGTTAAFDLGLGIIATPSGLAQQLIKDSQKGTTSAPTGLVSPNIPDDVRRKMAERLRWLDRTSGAQDKGDLLVSPAKTGGEKGADTATPTAVDRYVQNAEKAIRLLEAEAAALGRTRQERQIALDLARAENAAKERGAPLNERELAQIKQLAARRAQLTEQIRRQKEAEEAVKQASHFLGRQALDALTDIIVEGQKAEDVLKRLAIAFANAALQASLFGTGPFAKLGLFGGAGEGGLFGLLGKGFAGLFATGGHIPAGQWGIAGEKGPEIITGPANVIPAIRAGGMGTPSFVIHNYGEAGLVSVRQVGDMMDIRVAEAFRYTDMQVAGSERMTMARVSEQRARSAT